MNSPGRKTCDLLLVLLMGICLPASGLCAQGGATPNGPQKPVAPSPTAATRPTTTHTVAKKVGTPSTPSHSLANLKTVPHSGMTKPAPAKPAPHAASTYPAKSPPTRTMAHASQRAPAPARRWRPRTLNGWQRLARLHLQPQRVQEIQQALIREGYLRGDANGQWDSQTRDAMLRYQTDHGFPATGLPEAKSLMKLGLGSHPLPQELDHGPPGVASSSPAPGALSMTPSLPPASQATTPPQ